jgi:hypothetical protein
LGFLRFLSGVASAAHRYDHRNAGSLLSSDRLSRLFQVLGAVVAIDPVKHFGGHAEVSGGLPNGDPIGTPLNIRLTPNGQVVDRLGNGVRIQVFDSEDRVDSRGRRWYLISLPRSSAPDGYVFADFVRCP